MKRALAYIASVTGWFLIILFLGLGVFGVAQQVTTLGTPRIESYGLFAVNGSGVNGNLQVATEGNQLKFTVTVYTMQPGERHAVALFEGDCGPDRTLVAQLGTVPNLEGDLFSSLTYLNLPFEQVTQGNHFAYVYATDEINQANIVACGEVGLGANANSSTPVQPMTTEAVTTDAMTTDTMTTDTMTTDTDTMTAEAMAQAATDPAVTDSTTTGGTVSQAGPNDALRTVSYGIFPIEGSSISGKLQLQETLEQTVRATLTLSGSVTGEYHSAAIFAGDCSPNGTVVVPLQTVGESIPEDPFASLTFIDTSYDALTTGNHFVMVFGPELSSPALACGEVGVGANQ
jgi:hypothetical protein